MYNVNMMKHTTIYRFEITSDDDAMTFDDIAKRCAIVDRVDAKCSSLDRVIDVDDDFYNEILTHDNVDVFIDHNYDIVYFFIAR